MVQRQEIQPDFSSFINICSVKKNSSDYVYFCMAEFDCGWKDWVDKEPLEDDGYSVTHFCIPDPIEND